jgi:hypothetical protein
MCVRQRTLGTWTRLRALLPRMIVAFAFLEQTSYVNQNFVRFIYSMDVENRGLPFNSVLDGDANAVNEEPAEQAFAHLSASAVFEGLEWTVEHLSACFTLTVASRHVLEAVFGEPIIQGRRGFVPHLRIEGHIKLSIALNTLLDRARQETWIGLPRSSIPAGKYPFVASTTPLVEFPVLCFPIPFDFRRSRAEACETFQKFLRQYAGGRRNIAAVVTVWEEFREDTGGFSLSSL